MTVRLSESWCDEIRLPPAQQNHRATVICSLPSRCCRQCSVLTANPLVDASNEALPGLALRCLQWPQTLNATVGSVTSDFCFLRSAAAAAMHSYGKSRRVSED